MVSSSLSESAWETSLGGRVEASSSVSAQASVTSSGSSAPETTPTTSSPVVRSSGLFALPANAASVDWMVLNNTSSDQTVTVTVYKAGVGPKAVLPPGALTMTIPPGEAIHNANNAGYSGPFVPGFSYEVVMVAAHPDVLPSVHVWEDHGNTVIPGTLIPPGNWVTLN